MSKLARWDTQRYLQCNSGYWPQAKLQEAGLDLRDILSTPAIIGAAYMVTLKHNYGCIMQRQVEASSVFSCHKNRTAK